jgi:MFS family permease
MTEKQPRIRQIIAAVIGNALEWYDFVVYGFFTVIISRLFFPAQSEYASLLLTMATFGVGFFMRPVGGIVLGIYADQKGRKPALQLIIGLMTLSMATIACAPPYAAIGIAAPLLVLLARLLQGFATGGEFASATAFLVESAPARRRGFYGSLQMVGQSVAALSGAIAGALVTRTLAPAQIYSWGWRLPFIFGLIIGPVGLYIRRYLEETEAFLESRAARPGTGGRMPPCPYDPATQDRLRAAGERYKCPWCSCEFIAAAPTPAIWYYQLWNTDLAALGPGHRHAVCIDSVHGDGRRVANPHDHHPAKKFALTRSFCQIETRFPYSGFVLSNADKR